MEISLHLLLAVAHVAAALLVLVARPGFRSRVRHPKALSWLAIGSAVLLLPAHVASTGAGAASMLHTALVVASLAVVVALVVLSWHTPAAPRQEPTGRRVLAIGASDSLLAAGCGGTLMRLRAAGHEVHTMVLTSGEQTTGGREMFSSSSRHNLPAHRLRDFGDEMAHLIEARIAATNPDLVLTHSPNDQDRNLVSVHWATLRAARSQQAVASYESPTVTADFDPHVFVDISEHLADKLQALSGTTHPWRAPDLLAASSGMRGLQGKMLHAEGLEAVRLPAFSGVL